MPFPAFAPNHQRLPTGGTLLSSRSPHIVVASNYGRLLAMLLDAYNRLNPCSACDDRLRNQGYFLFVVLSLPRNSSTLSFRACAMTTVDDVSASHCQQRVATLPVDSLHILHLLTLARSDILSLLTMNRKTPPMICLTTRDIGRVLTGDQPDLLNCLCELRCQACSLLDHLYPKYPI